LPRTAELAARIVRLPLSSALSDAEVARVIASFPG
jgi:dTDP-4-amino-4,6-dideoxygalactose transaminase